ncbi:MAG: zinc-binding dehydrogenase [bacterium]|nr:zinc-binding dehydrogenase [bacterium]MDE0290075.1 zinc-binding dehydrogenase [bacterium]MDE0437472.1 zinc-binding dehydrogenase [bacterium]
MPVEPGQVSRPEQDPASNPRVWNEVLKTLRNRARVVVCGSHAGPMVQLNNNWLFRSRVAIYGSAGSTRRGMQRCPDLAAAGLIAPAIDPVWPLSSIREAYTDLGSRRNVRKIVLRGADGDGQRGS